MTRPHDAAPKTPPTWLADISDEWQPLRRRLLAHDLYTQLTSPAALRVFMQHHVFAVWDFMSVLKALQRMLTCVDLPWMPRGPAAARRFVNEIVMAEESDEDGRGGFASHFEIYLDAMREAGADTAPIVRFLDRLQKSHDVTAALDESGAPEGVKTFVGITFEIIGSADVAAIAGAFTFGREEIIPDMFRRVVAEGSARAGGIFERFSYYLDRHIGLDADAHAPMALRMLGEIVARDNGAGVRVAAGARAALAARVALWDGIAAALPRASDRQPTGPALNV
jgi:hypothetical protein